MKNFTKDDSLIGERNAAIEFFCLVGLLHPNLPFGLSRLLAFAAFDVLKSILFSEFVNLFFDKSFQANKKPSFFRAGSKKKHGIRPKTTPHPRNSARISG
jgi:hypothetical protein